MKTQLTKINIYLGAITGLLIIFKFGGLINWSWWWILAPSWVPPALFGVFYLSMVFYQLYRYFTAKGV
jgi:hypothetical protein